MKLDVEVLTELRKIRNAIDDMYDKLNKPLYNKVVAAKVSYSEVNPFDLVQENFEYISKTIRELQDSEIVGEE
tara:strand:- start:165 stop:383 length:219 start_codon:yes stop_codon:yes gene_type:complete